MVTLLIKIQNVLIYNETEFTCNVRSRLFKNNLIEEVAFEKYCKKRRKSLQLPGEWMNMDE